jgi:flagellar capping protein FliD
MENPSQIEESFFLKENLNLQTALKKAEQTIEKLLFENQILSNRSESLTKVNTSLQRDIQRVEAKLENKEKDHQLKVEDLMKVSITCYYTSL